MKKILLITFMFVTALVTQSWAQDRVISGKVTSAEDGSALPGVNVVLKGTTTGTATDIDGNFKFSAPGEGGTLIFSFIGLTAKEVAIGNQSTINVVMASDAKQLSEVVVTALGLTREKAALGYGVTTVSSDDIQARPEADVARVLRGKVPGVDITSTSGIAGSGTNIIIRGFSSITGSNQPLFVIDGVPFNTDTNTNRGFTSGGATASSRFLDLDPNNIANISVLKGLSATVLYGEAGRNGVVLVTTKTGTGGADSQKKMEVSFTQSYNVNEVAGIPETQDKYGNGWQNAAAAAFSNWGAPFDKPGFNGLDAEGTIKHPYDRAALNSALPQYVGARYKYKAYDNLAPFFVKGSQVNTSLNVSSALSDVSSVSVGYAYLKDNGYTPNNDYAKHNVSIGFNTKLKNGLSVRASGNFISSEANKPPAATIFSSNPGAGSTSLFSNVLYTPRSVDLHGLEYANPVDGSSIYYRGGNDIQHPLWTLNNTNDNEIVRRFFGNVALGYKLTDWLDVSYRMGVDTYTQEQNFEINRAGRQIPDGLFVTTEDLNFITDQLLTFNVDYDLTADLNLHALLGVNLRKESRKFHAINSTEQFISGLFDHSNFGTTTAGTFVRDELTNAVFGEITLGYRNFAYINLLARNDWTSTLEKENRSILYPSVSVSLLPMEAFGVNTNMVNNLKLRVSYGTSAGYPDPYQTRPTLSTNPKRFKDAGGSVIKTVTVSNQFANPDLKPELLTEFEIGIEGSFINDRVGLDLSLYNKNSNDLIIALLLDPSTGSTVSTINSASLENKGIEIGLNITPITLGDFNWNFAVNFTKNVSEVKSIAPGIDQIVIAGFTNLGNFAIPGQPYGVIKGQTIVRDDNGVPVVNANGTYQATSDIAQIADPNPDFKTSLINTISYKFLSFRAQIDYTKGGDIYGSTASTLTARGIAQETDFDRFVPVITPGVNADGTPNTKQITSNRHYWENTGVFYDENRIFDGTTVRLREISLTVTAPKNWLSKTPFGTASITFAGQNLWYKAVNFPESINFDPEVLSTGVGNSQGFDYVTGPTAKKYGATLSLTF